MKRFPIITSETALLIFRMAVSGILMAHGIMRIMAGTVDDFGNYLDSRGFMIGHAIAWFLTLFEIIGGLCIALGFLVRWVAAIFIIEHFFGIILVHAPNGWFVVGHQSGGVEFSVLIIFSLLTIAAISKPKP
jgi:putative oxidoreductase